MPAARLRQPPSRACEFRLHGAIVRPKLSGQLMPPVQLDRIVRPVARDGGYHFGSFA
jgi:hypothetical protein